MSSIVDKFNSILLPSGSEHTSLEAVKEFLETQSGNLLTDFLEFEDIAQQYLETADTTLSTQITREPVALQEHLSNLVALSYSLGQVVADGDTYVVLFSALAFQPKRQKVSETDRKLLTEVHTIKQANLLAKMKNAEEKIDKQITVCQSFLKAETAKMMKDGGNL